MSGVLVAVSVAVAGAGSVVAVDVSPDVLLLSVVSSAKTAAASKRISNKDMLKCVEARILFMLFYLCVVRIYSLRSGSVAFLNIPDKYPAGLKR